MLFLEHKALYNVRGPVPEEEYLIPFGVADVKREGRDATAPGLLVPRQNLVCPEFIGSSV